MLKYTVIWMIFVCLCCSDFYMARYLEDQDRHNNEKKGEEEEKTETTSDTTTPRTPALSKDKKGGDKGRVKITMLKFQCGCCSIDLDGVVFMWMV